MDIKSNKGISLVEVIATVAIMAIIMVPISLIFITSYTNFISESDKAVAEQCAREVLYGKGISSYGVMGDLERSSASKNRIKLEDNFETGKYRIIKITDSAGSTGTQKIYRFDKDERKLFYDDGSGEKDFFDQESSINNHTIEVIDFVAEYKSKGTVINKAEIDTDVVIISATVLCGKSGNIKVESSYRINVED